MLNKNTGIQVGYIELNLVNSFGFEIVMFEFLRGSFMCAKPPVDIECGIVDMCRSSCRGDWCSC